MRDPLSTAVDGTHRALDEQLADVRRAVEQREPTYLVTLKTDAFMIHACRHVSAICTTVAPTARRTLPDGRLRVRAYVRQARRLERSIAQAKRRLYGASRSIRLPWSLVSAALDHELAELLALERALIADVAEQVGPRASSRLAALLPRSEAGSPTRPHPNSPHTGWVASLSRRGWTRADCFWDAVEGRVVAGAVKAFKAPARLTP